MSQVKKKCRRESFQLFLHVSKDIRFPSPSFDLIFKSPLKFWSLPCSQNSINHGFLDYWMNYRKFWETFSFNFFIEKFFAEYVYMYI